jgi:ketosteroid isomerase-like protein
MGARSSDEIIRELADLEAIRDLARRYAHYVWQKDAAGAIELFTDDAVMDTGDRPPIAGRPALRAEYAPTFHLSTITPFVHNHVVELAGDRATGTCYLDLRAITEEGVAMTGFGFYEDRYQRAAGGWKFASRRLELAEYREA